MDNKTDLDKLMFLLGQENAVEELNCTTEPHEFSEKYKSERMKIINNQDSFQSINKKGKKIMKKKIIVLIAAITATLAISATAYGAVRHYLVTTSKNEETGTLTYNFEEEAPITKIPVIKITPEYLPEGYIEKEHTPGKYHPNGDFSLGGISIFQNYCLDGSEEPYVSGVEETTINGIKSHIITREGLEYNHVIKLFYEDGQIIDIMAADSVPFDEVKKVAENIKYEVIPGEFIDLKANEANEEEIIKYVEPAITTDHVFNIGEEISDEGFPDRNPTFTVNNIEVLDKLPELDKNYFCDYNQYLEFINEDGTLKERERVNSTKWENNKMNTVTETVGMKFVSVTLTMRNPFEKELKDINIYPRVYSMKETSNGTFEMLNDYWGCELSVDKAPFYFDQSDYEGKHFYFCDFEPNETKEVHLIYAVDEDQIDNAYIKFEQSGTTSFVGSYIKVTK
ncbi:hypothetical protein [uncultured Clostridium sp.]|uniref:hypothetical protein n=1 Tax=uncultured Clostridium sp. TaxID=59620 RepID=UPI003217C2C7